VSHSSRCQPETRVVRPHKPEKDVQGRRAYIGRMSARAVVRRTVAALCLVAPLSISGLGSLGPATAAAAVSIPTCDDSYLSVTISASNGAAGTAFQNIVIVNVAKRACALQGYPTLQFRWGAGTRPAAREVHDTGNTGRPMVPRRVILRPDGVASSVITYGDFATSSSPTCTVTTIRVMLPPVSRFSTVFAFAGAIPLCGEHHVIGVSPIQAGPTATW
jgi:Domain of unknown function (DUF4232)